MTHNSFNNENSSRISSASFYIAMRTYIARTMSIEHVFGNLYFECYNIIRRQNFAHLYRFIPFYIEQWALRLKHAIYIGEKNSNKIELTQNILNNFIIQQQKITWIFPYKFSQYVHLAKIFQVLFLTSRMRVHFFAMEKTCIFMNVKMELKSCEFYICSFFVLLLNVKIVVHSSIACGIFIILD